MTLDRSVVFATPHLESVVSLTGRAEAEGFFGAWTTEYTDRDALIRSTVAGMRTQRIRVGTGIAYGFTRHPLALATAALDVHEATGGRFRLGLGSGTGGMRGRWYGMPSTRPVSLLREVAELIRGAWNSDGDFRFSGRIYAANVPDLHLRERSSALPALPIMGSGIGPGMVAGAARWFDGVLLHPLAVSQEYEGRTLLPSLSLGLAARTQPTPFRQVQWVLTSVNEDRAAAFEFARRSLAFYLSTASYAQHFAATRWEDAQRTVELGFRKLGADWVTLAAHVPDSLVEELCVVGTAEEARQRVDALEQRLAERGCEEIVFQVSAISSTVRETELAFRAVLESLGSNESVASGVRQLSKGSGGRDRR